MHISLLPLWNAINDNSNGNNGNDDYDGGNGNNKNNSNGIDDSWRSTCAILLSAASTMNSKHTRTHMAHISHQENRCKSGKTVCYAIKVC